VSDKVVVTAALAGSVTKKEHNPHVPYTPEEFVREARRAEEAGAAVVHIHFRHPDTGEPTTDPAVMEPIVTGIREECNVLLMLAPGSVSNPPWKSACGPSSITARSLRLSIPER